jgi:hypothetical protein
MALPGRRERQKRAATRNCSMNGNGNQNLGLFFSLFSMRIKTTPRPGQAQRTLYHPSIAFFSLSANHQFEFRWRSFIQPTLHLGVMRWWLFSNPRSCRRASQGKSGAASLVFEPRRVVGARRVRRAPIFPRSAGSLRRLRGVLLFGDFLLDKQEKVTCRGSATHK